MLRCWGGDAPLGPGQANPARRRPTLAGRLARGQRRKPGWHVGEAPTRRSACTSPKAMAFAAIQGLREWSLAGLAGPAKFRIPLWEPGKILPVPLLDLSDHVAEVWPPRVPDHLR